MSSSDNMPLSQLAASLMDADASPDVRDHVRDHAREHVHHEHAEHSEHAEHGCGHSWWSFVFYFLVLALVLYFVFFALRPSFVLKSCNDSHSRSASEDHDQEIDNGKLLGSAIVVALVIMFIFWLFYYLMQWVA